MGVVNGSALMAAVSAVVVLAGCAPAQDGASAPSTTVGETTSRPTPAFTPPAVTLDGLYVIEWTGSGTRNGVAVDDLRREKNGWAFRTACDDDGCVATG